jgi:hypothetical protein
VPAVTTQTPISFKGRSRPEDFKRSLTWQWKIYLEGAAIDFPIEFHLQPVGDIHLHSNYRFEHEPNGNTKYLTILLAIAFLILISAGLNYLNLYSSVSARRINGIGIRIVNGATSTDIIAEFTIEAVLTGLISLILSFLLFFPCFQGLSEPRFYTGNCIPDQNMVSPVMFIDIPEFCCGISTGDQDFKCCPCLVLKKRTGPEEKEILPQVSSYHSICDRNCTYRQYNRSDETDIPYATGSFHNGY